MTRPRLLIVEDNEDLRRATRQRIEAVGDYDVRLAHNGREAILECEHWWPDLVLMDIHMPVMSGDEAIRRIRAMEGGERLPILVLYPHFLQGKEPPAKIFGGDGYVWKPIVDSLRLREILELHLREARSRPA